jgi:hypothetical protein
MNGPYNWKDADIPEVIRLINLLESAEFEIIKHVGEKAVTLHKVYKIPLKFIIWEHGGCICRRSMFYATREAIKRGRKLWRTMQNEQLVICPKILKHY